MRKNHCLFPVKLMSLLDQAVKNPKWIGNQHRLDGMPQDDKTRVMLMTPEMHDAFDGHHKGEYTRFRLAIVPGANIVVEYAETTVEVYSAEGVLLKAYHMEDLNHQQALAVQAELMYAYIENLGGYINSL